MKNFVVVSGMFRSGTTLLGTMLNAHPEVGFSLDPFLPLFKSFRSAISRRVGVDIGSGAMSPLDDYYFYPQKQRVLDAIQRSSFSTEVQHGELPLLRERLAGYADVYSPKLVPHLDGLDGECYLDLVRQSMKLVEDCYGDSNNEIFGFKHAWTDEFHGQFVNDFANTKVIHLVRDPRAVCASKNVNERKYPWLFLIRQWRKSASFIWNNAIREGFDSERTLFVRYEDVILNPVPESKRICEFLGIRWDQAMVNPEGFVDGVGKPWIQNTSYKSKAKPVFNKESLTRWKTVLSDREQACIERLCGPEMDLLGYGDGLRLGRAFPDDLMFEPPAIAHSDLAEWIRDEPAYRGEGHIQEMALERWRWEMIHGTSGASIEVKKRACLLPAVFEEVRRRRETILR